MVRALTQTVRGAGLSPSQSYILFNCLLYVVYENHIIIYNKSLDIDNQNGEYFIMGSYQ